MPERETIKLTFGRLTVWYERGEDGYWPYRYEVFAPEDRPFDFATAVTDGERDYRVRDYYEAPEFFGEELREEARALGIELPLVSAA